MNRIRECRQNKKLTLKQASKELATEGLNLSADALGKYERSERFPKLETWEKLDNFFNVSVTYLMGISDQTLKLYRVSTSFDSYIVKAASEERAKELVWLDEVEAIPESWTDEYDVQELDIKNMDVEGVISRGN